MHADSGKPLHAFGFLTVLESPHHGLFGGYLVLSPQGRPLEFRCSTPIAPSRAQVILYGPTLRPYLLADVIGQALVSQAESVVDAIITDQRDMLALADLRAEPVVCVDSAAGEASETGQASFDLAGHHVTAYPMAAEARERLQRLLAPLAAHVDLLEPFGRIRAALNEAQVSSSHAKDYGDERAAA